MVYKHLCCNTVKKKEEEEKRKEEDFRRRKRPNKPTSSLTQDGNGYPKPEYPTGFTR